MQKLFTSDLHLGHKSIVKYRDIFSTMEEHDNFIINKILELPKRTVLTILGDFLFDGPHFESYIERLSKKKCRIEVVMGNHDSLLLYSIPKEIIEMQLPFYSYKNMWVSHCPINNSEMRNRTANIHGHLHKEVIDDNRYFNVNLDVNDYDFVPFETIRNRFL